MLNSQNDNNRENILYNESIGDENTQAQSEIENSDNSKHELLSQYTKGQKIAVISLALFAFMVMFLWAIQFKQGFSFRVIEQGVVSQNQGIAGVSQSEEARLRSQDTDGDGLSDWDELYIYGTSPYLEDTDGDGISDYDEIMMGTDPNCPANTDCGVLGPLYESGGQPDLNYFGDEMNILEQLELFSGLLDSVSIPEEESAESLQSLLSGQGSAADLRKMLLDSGMDQALLSQISDEELMQVYNEMLNE